ncbi:uncharacterized protein LOC128218385 [Mya arenaria]|uniref:uncharacterized protein LOC128218385 n=1 Tax=Mya arenaria TaxID=6604 RepID=UPI0022E97ABC|nr:uncharacterized protein LOC128218385 [Mya arenaria]
MALPNGNMEIVFSFDTTGSMSSCLNEVRGRISDMAQRLQADIPGIKIGIFAHGDYCDKHNYITKHVDLTTDITKLMDFVQNVKPTGGGDSDECYELVLHEVRTKLSWTPGTQRALVMIGDCNPHEPNYPQNKLKLDWRKEADALAGIGVRIYSVQCASYGADHFYGDIAKRTGGQHLKLSDFKNVFDFLMTVCYREKSDDLFTSYEKEVRARCGKVNKDIDKLFGDLRDKAPMDTDSAMSSKSDKPLTKAKKVVTAKAVMTKKTSVTKVKTPPKRLRRPKSSANKFADKNLPKLRRENVPENNFLMRQLNWSPWKLAMSTNKIDGGACVSRKAGGFRVKELFSGKTKVPAIYEVAIQPKYRCRKYVVFRKMCRRGFRIEKRWERNIFSGRNIQQQLSKCLQNNCKVFMRRLLLDNGKVTTAVRRYVTRYDYAWKNGQSSITEQREVTRAGVQISV